LEGLRLLDVGCGSGLVSLAARRMGAQVHSFDYDSDSVDCALRLKERFYPQDENWTIEQGSVLDRRYLAALGKFDIVYSFGVLHHTGDLWAALDDVTLPLKPGGKLLVAIYNDQGTKSRCWRYLKQKYNRGSVLARRAIEGIVWLESWGQYFLRDLICLTPLRTWRMWKSYATQRGMSPLARRGGLGGRLPLRGRQTGAGIRLLRAAGILFEGPQDLWRRKGM
jgi:2-polyprenyl-6-hydroxyphenyl methylase/3-demethylubiquinone-9 3-methyltransferase